MSEAGTPRSGADTPRAGCLGHCVRLFSHTLFAGFLLCVGVRLLFRDTLPHPGQLLYYLAPLPVLSCLALPEFLLQLVRRKPRKVIATGLCFLLPLGLWINSSHRDLSDPEGKRDPDALRLVFWTADNFQFTTIEQAAKALPRFDADLLILNEGVIDLGTQKHFFGKHFPEHQVIFLPWDRFALVRGKVLAQHFSHTRWMDGTLVQLLVECREQRFIALLFDHRSDPDVSRKDALTQLASTIDHFTGQPLLLMGDFNTPADSAFLAPVRKRLVDAFDLAGSGWKETWPVPLPLLTLDQVWLSPAVEASRAYHARLGRSHHEAVVVDFRAHPIDDIDALAFPAPYPAKNETTPAAPAAN